MPIKITQDDVEKIGTVLRISTVPFFVRTQLKNQINDFLTSGIEIIIASSPGLELSEFNNYGNLKIVDINIRRKISFFSDIKAFIELTLFLYKNNVRILHSTTPKAGFLASLAGFLARVPIRFHTYTGQPWVENKGISSALSKFCDAIIGKVNTYTFADSESQRLFLIESGIVKSEKISVIGSGSLAGVDLSRFDSTKFSETTKELIKKKLSIPSDGIICLFLGRITPSKGVREILEAFKHVTPEIKKVYLLFVGPIEADYKKEFEIEIASTPYVIYLGLSLEPEKYISIASILCLPSYREGFGTSVIEAAAMGVPAIGSNIYGLKDAIINGQTGLLVEPKNSKQFLDALRFLILNPNVRLSYGLSARIRASKLFDSNIVSQLVVDEYLKWATRKLYP
jgi:glycosyltransferase involved in cell wall biosynthesis